MSVAPASPFRIVLAGVIAMAAGMGFGRFVYTPILPAMMEQLDLSASDMGLIASSNYLGYLLGAIFAAGGWAAGRERALMLAALAANAVLLAAMALTENVIAFVLIRLLAGIASAFVMIFLTATIYARLASMRRDDLQGRHFSGVGLGIASSSIVTGMTIGMGSGWSVPWLWSAAVSLVVLMLVALMIPRQPGAVSAKRRESPLPKSLPLTLVIVAYGLFGLGYIVTATFFIAIVRATGTEGHLESYVWFATGLAGLLSVWFWAKVAARIGLVTAYVVGCLVEAAGVIISVAVGGSVALIVAGILFGGTFIAITALGLQIGRQLSPEAPRRVLAIMTASFGIGQIIGPVVAGFMADWTGDFILPSVGAGLILVASGALVLAARPAVTK
ncbi:MAG TPA: YbfB/YjiJ family MFS transporter [Rhizobiaceae bacterium]|nr:YbfB/YjiJ family MFS transporter [Rhizobiaceae bacterium]